MDTRSLIKLSLRSIGALDTSQEPTPSQADEALDTLNGVLKAMQGQEIGLRLDTVALTGAAAGVPWAMYQAALAAAATLTLPANPQDGWRFGFKDTKANFATYNLTVNPNNRLISTSIGVYSAGNQAYSTNGQTKTFFFRSDEGWTEEVVLTLTDTPYFPVDFHVDLANILSLSLYPQYWPGQTPDAMLVGLSQASRERFAARYNGRATALRARKVG